MYAVKLRFAVPLNLREEERREVAVIVENDNVLSAYNPADRSGLDRADDYTLHVPVSDGQRDVRFSPRIGQPFGNALRVTRRPDR